jgi:hypothetical protein
VTDGQAIVAFVKANPMLAAYVFVMGSTMVLAQAFALLWFVCSVLSDLTMWIVQLRRARTIRKELLDPPPTNTGQGKTSSQKPPTPPLDFHRRQLTEVDDRWLRLQLDGLILAPGDRKERL